MARGQILTIPTNSAVLVTTLSREQKASVSILNPNDGICYVKMNGPASTSQASWDWKIPSQSYCQLPGPWESLGVFYLDQSGSGRTAEVNVYELDSQIGVPSFLAIGRAVQAAGSAVDISQGTQPSNPPTSTVRLWADGSGNLHFLSSTGVDKTVLDTSNYNSLITLTGDVIGPLSNSLVQYRNATTVSVRDSGGTLRNHLTFGGETLWWAGPGGGFRWVNASNSVQWLALDATGLTVAATLYLTNTSHALQASGNNVRYVAASGGIHSFESAAGGYAQLNALSLTATNGYLYLPDNTHYILQSGNYFYIRSPNGILVQDSAGNYVQASVGSLNVNAGVIQCVGGQGLVLGTTGSYAYIWFGPQGDGIYIARSGSAIAHSANSILSGVGSWAVAGGSNNNGQTFYSAGGSAGPTGWQIISTERYKSNINTIDDALAIVLDPSLHGIHYTKTITAELTGGENAVDSEPFSEYGFLAEPWSVIAPDVVGYHEGLVHMMDYGQVNAILFEAVKQYISQTNSRLDKLENVAGITT